MKIWIRCAQKKPRTKKPATRKGLDPGAVIPGVQAQWIQPLVFRANQGDCVKIKLSNKLEEGGGPVSLHIHGSSMVVSATGAAATTTNPDSVVEEKKTGEFEWYIHPNTQEGVRQFHTYSQDRELTVMGLFWRVRCRAARIELPGAARRGRSNAGLQWLADDHQKRYRSGLPRVCADLSRSRRRGLPPAQ